LALQTAVAKAKLSAKNTAARWRRQTWTRQTYMHNTDTAAIAEVVMCVSDTRLSSAEMPRAWATKMTGMLSRPGAIGSSDSTWPPLRTNHHGRLSEGVSGLTR
jgi:hypothetical protein